MNCRGGHQRDWHRPQSRLDGITAQEGSGLMERVGSSSGCGPLCIVIQKAPPGSSGSSFLAKCRATAPYVRWQRSAPHGAANQNRNRQHAGNCQRRPQAAGHHRRDSYPRAGRDPCRHAQRTFWQQNRDGSGDHAPGGIQPAPPGSRFTARGTHDCSSEWQHDPACAAWISG